MGTKKKRVLKIRPARRLEQFLHDLEDANEEGGKDDVAQARGGFR